MWKTAREREESVEIHIAVGDVVDVQSDSRYPLNIEPGAQRFLPDSEMPLPVFSLEGLLITKLMALRDNDVVDVVALLVQHFNQVDGRRFWNQVGGAGLAALLENRLAELVEILRSKEVDAIWWDRLGLMLDPSERRLALESLRRLQKTIHKQP